MIELISPELSLQWQKVIDFCIKLVSDGGYLTVFITMTLESALIPIPSEVIMPFAGYMVYLGKLNLIIVSLIATISNLIGSAIAYSIGLYGGRPLILKYGKYILLKKHHLEQAEKFFQRHGDMSVLIGRCLPLIRTIIALPAGFSKMNFIKFAVFTFIGSLPWNLALTGAGFALGENWEKILGIIHYLDILILTGISIIIVWVIVKKLKNIKKKNSI